MQVYESTLDTQQNQLAQAERKLQQTNKRVRHDENGDLLNNGDESDEDDVTPKPVKKSNSKFLSENVDEDEDSEESLAGKYSKHKLQDSD